MPKDSYLVKELYQSFFYTPSHLSRTELKAIGRTKNIGFERAVRLPAPNSLFRREENTLLLIH